MSKRKFHHGITRVLLGVMLFGVGMACQLTSPRPASWAGTPTAEAQKTIFALTQSSIGSTRFVFTPTVSATLPPSSTATFTATPVPTKKTKGPWLIYPASHGTALSVRELDTGTAFEIPLPEPILIGDLITGRSPEGHKLFIRAGSVMNAEELALYQIDLYSFEVNRVTPLLSIKLQRQIVNQEGTRAVDAFATVTRPDGLAWSPDGRFLAFSAALNNDNSDLYIYDTFNKRVTRVNFFLTQNASPTWGPTSKWLISQELENNLPDGQDGYATLVTGLIAPGFILIDQIYQPPVNSLEEVFIGWLNESIFICYSLTSSGPANLRSINVNRLQENIIFEGPFQGVAFDTDSKTLALLLTFEQAIPLGMNGGIYRISLDDNSPQIQQEGNWGQLYVDPTGVLIASGSSGILIFNPTSESTFFPGFNQASLSPDKNWLIAWNNNKINKGGAQLFQVNNNTPLQTLASGHVENVFWRPDSKAFFIQSEGFLYHFVFPGLKPYIFSDDLPKETAVPLIWVEQ